MGELASSNGDVNVFDHLEVILDTYFEASMVTFGTTVIMLTQSALEALASMQAEDNLWNLLQVLQLEGDQVQKIKSNGC